MGCKDVHNFHISSTFMLLDSSIEDIRIPIIILTKLKGGKFMSLESMFRLRENKTSVKQEVLAGIATGQIGRASWRERG